MCICVELIALVLGIITSVICYQNTLRSQHVQKNDFLLYVLIKESVFPLYSTIVTYQSFSNPGIRPTHYSHTKQVLCMVSIVLTRDSTILIHESGVHGDHIYKEVLRLTNTVVKGLSVACEHGHIPPCMQFVRSIGIQQGWSQLFVSGTATFL